MRWVWKGGFRTPKGIAHMLPGVWVLSFPMYFNCCHFILNTENGRSPSRDQLIFWSSMKLWLLILEICQYPFIWYFNMFCWSNEQIYFEKKSIINFLTKYMDNLCVPAIVYYNFYVLLCVTWNLFLIESWFSTFYQGRKKCCTIS